MTEAEWLACTDPEPMLKFLRGKAGSRKLRLFACACLRRVWHLLIEEPCRTAVEVSERYADGLATREELDAAWYEATHAARWPVTGRVSRRLPTPPPLLLPLPQAPPARIRPGQSCHRPRRTGRSVPL